jgi:hypothetical protein
MSTPFPDYTTCIQRLLTEIQYRYEHIPQYDATYWDPFHTWILDTLGPTSSYSMKQLADAEQSAGTLIERAYPYTSTGIKLVFAKLATITLLIDDSIEDETVYREMAQFSHKLYLGETQQSGMLVLYHENMKELSYLCGDDGALRGLIVGPWITFIDACLMEKQIFTAEVRFEY